MWHIRQSLLDYGLGCQAEVLGFQAKFLGFQAKVRA